MNSDLVFRVRAWKKWNHTGFVLLKGARYRLTAKTGDYWIDLTNSCDAGGYPSNNALLRKVERHKRIPDANWFALIATYGQSLDDAIVVGRDSTFTAVRDGELVMFANDLEAMYFNNFGYIDVAVEIVDAAG
jgi:hypothetical protein